MLPHCLSLWCRWCTVHGVVCAPNCSWFPLGSCGLLYFLHKLLFWNSSSICSVVQYEGSEDSFLVFFLKKGLKKNYFPTLKSLILIDSLWNIPVIWYPENGYMVHICSGVQNFVYCEKLLFFWIGFSFFLSNLLVRSHLCSRLVRESEHWWYAFCFVFEICFASLYLESCLILR